MFAAIKTKVITTMSRRGGRTNGGGNGNGRGASTATASSSTPSVTSKPVLVDVRDTKEYKDAKEAKRRAAAIAARQASSANRTGAAANAGTATGSRLSEKDKEKEAEERKAAAAAAALAAEEKAKRDAEEQQKREAEEKKRLEDEEKKRIADEKDKADKEVRQRSEQERKQWTSLVALRETNIKAIAAKPPSVKLLDSTIKKIESYIRKLRTLSEHPTDVLVGELKTLNLTKFLSEIANAIIEVKLAKPADVNKCVQICSAMVQRYTEFTAALVPPLLRFFGLTKNPTLKRLPDTPTPNIAEDDPAMSLRRRSTLRLLVELYYAGIFDDAMAVRAILHDFIKVEVPHDDTHSTVQLIVSFVRYAGEEFAGLVARSKQQSYTSLQLPIIDKSSLVPASERTGVQTLLLNYSKSVTERLQTIHRSMRKRERKNNKMRLMRGQVPDDMAAKATELRDSFEKLHPQVILLLDLLDRPPLELVDEPDEEDDEFASASIESADLSATERSLWDDEEMRSFYEDIPNLQLIVPPVLLQDGNEKEKQKARRAKEAEEAAANATDGDHHDDTKDATPAAATEKKDSKTSSASSSSSSSSSSGNDSNSNSSGGYDDQDLEFNDGDYRSMQDAGWEEDDDGYWHYRDDDIAARKPGPLDIVFAALPSAFNREAVDSIAEKFCYHNNRANRQKLVQVAFRLHRNKQDSLPYYSRLVATLNQCFKDIGNDLITLLQSEFWGLFKRGGQFRVESRQRNIRYIAELTKFKVAPSHVAFRCWRSCLTNFSGQNVIVVCALLEACGRWLYRNPETHLRCAKFLEQTMQLKDTKFMEANLKNMLDNAYFQCKPPVASAFLTEKVRSPMHQYIRKSLYVDLNPSNVESILKRLRMLTWDSECLSTVIKCLANVANVKYWHIGELASVAAGLNKYHSIGVPLVDAVLEEVRVGLEMNELTQRQRRIAYMKYLAELYTYQMFQDQVIFDTLYLMITFGHNQGKNGEVESVIDPPADYFRIRLICLLLDSTGEYFSRGSSRRRLDRFLIYFQRYILMKDQPLPIDIDHIVTDLYFELRPKQPRALTMEDANEKIVALENDAKASTRDRLISLADLKDAAGEEDDEQSGDDDDGEPDDDEKKADGDDDDDLEGDDDDGEGDEEGDEEEDDEEEEGFGRNQGPPERKSKEDQDFMAEFDKLMADSVESRKYEKRVVANIAPAQTLSASSSSSGSGRRVVSGDDDQDHVVFKLVMRAAKGGKSSTVTRDLLIPADNDMAVSTASHEEAERINKEKRKQSLLELWSKEEKQAALQAAAASRREPSAVWHPSASAAHKEPEPTQAGGMDSYFDWSFAAELTRNPNQGRAVVTRPARGVAAGPGARNAGPNPAARHRPLAAGPPLVGGTSRPAT